MAQRSDESGSRQRILVIGHGRLVDVSRRALDDAGAHVVYLREPTDRQIWRALGSEVEAVMVICRDDRASRRLALVVEGLRAGVRLVVTIYNRDLGAQLRRAVPNVRVMSMADVVAQGHPKNSSLLPPNQDAEGFRPDARSVQLVRYTPRKGVWSS